jgi:hypothetical protein
MFNPNVQTYRLLLKWIQGGPNATITSTGNCPAKDSHHIDSMLSFTTMVGDAQNYASCATTYQHRSFPGVQPVMDSSSVGSLNSASLVI